METIKLDLIPGKKMPSLHASQYDDGRDYHIDLTENRVPYVLDGTETISLTVRKCDNTLVTMDIANTFANKSYIEFRTTEQMNACAGFNYGEITIEKNGTQISSLNFYLQVEGAPDEGGIQSQSEINNLARQVHDIVVEELADNGAEETGYDNTESGLEATNVQDAIDEVNTKIENIPSVDAYTKEQADDKFATKTELADKADVSAIPTKTSQLQNDSGFAQIDDTQTSASKTYSSDKVDEIASGKADKSELANVYGKYAGENLVDSSKNVEGFLESNGTISTYGAYASYITTEYIPLEANKTYTASNWWNKSAPYNTRLIYLLYTDIGSPVGATYYNNGSTAYATFNSGNYKYVRISTPNSNNLMFSKGEVPDIYVDYQEHYAIDCYLGEIALGQVRDIVKGEEKLIKLEKSGESVSVTSKVGGKFLKRTYNLTYPYTNGIFNFERVYYDNNIIKTSEDDIAPIRLVINGNNTTTIGANHGWEFAYKCALGELDTIDVGSLWTDGTTQYLLVSVYRGFAYFLPPVSKVGDMVYCQKIAPVSDLTHVSGAYHTSTIPLAGISNGQLYPSVNRRSLSLILDGEEITADGTYYPNKVLVKETYGIMDLYELFTYAGNHVGNVNYEDVDTICTLSHIYEITVDNEIVYTNLTANKPVELAPCGFLQAVMMNAIGGTVYRYVNGVGSGIFASSSLVDMTNYNTSNNILISDIKAGQFPNHCVDVCKNSGNNIIYGFALGFIPDMSDGSDTKRASNTTLWDMRSTKKIYPVCIQSKSLTVGEQISVVGYRAYFGAISGKTDEFTVKIGDKNYVVFDTHEVANGNVASDKLGNNVEVVSNDGIVVGDCVGASGIPYNSNNSYSAFIVKF